MKNVLAFSSLIALVAAVPRPHPRAMMSKIAYEAPESDEAGSEMQPTGSVTGVPFGTGIPRQG